MAWIAPLCESPHLWKGLAAGATLSLGAPGVGANFSLGAPGVGANFSLGAPGVGTARASLENALPVEPDIERRDDPRAARLRVREGNSASVKSA